MVRRSSCGPIACWIVAWTSSLLCMCMHVWLFVCSYSLSVCFVSVVSSFTTAEYKGDVQWRVQFFVCLPLCLCIVSMSSWYWVFFTAAHSFRYFTGVWVKVVPVLFTGILSLALSLSPVLVHLSLIHISEPTRHDHTTAIWVSLRWSGGLLVAWLPAGSWQGLPRWLHGLCMRCVVSRGSTFAWLVFFFGALRWGWIDR